MVIKIPQAQIYKTCSFANLKKQFQPRNIVSAMGSGGFLPVIALEAFVEFGRTYQAYQRGGFDEARERITEEFMGAIFWLGGVTGLNWVFEKLGQKLLKLPKKVVDVASDEVRNPLSTFLAKEKKIGSKTGEVISKSLMSKFKLIKVISSIVIANAFIGFILPKINQAITRSYHKNDKKNNNNSNNFIKYPSIENFGKNPDKNTSFTGRWDLLSIANLFENENNSIFRLLAVDAGTASGRAISARNNDERIEILFRDLGSIYFYMFCMGHLNSLLNRIEQGWNNKNTTRLDPASAKFATEYLQNYVGDRKIDIQTFGKEVLGENKELPDKLKSLFKDTGVITVEKLKELLPEFVSAEKLKEVEQIAEKMSKLQPVKMVEQTVDGQTKFVAKRILTANQVKDVLNGGHINNPEFLKEFYANALGTRKYFQNRSYKFIDQSKFDSLKKDLTSYVQSIMQKAQKSETKQITSSLLNKASKHNFIMNIINWGVGFVVSAAFLSTFIPKLQYQITKWRTGKNTFPGTEEFRPQDSDKKAA